MNIELFKTQWIDVKEKISKNEAKALPALFSWTVGRVHSKNPFSLDYLIFINNKTSFSVCLPLQNNLENLIEASSFIEAGMKEAFKNAGFDQELIDEYFKQAGEFNYFNIKRPDNFNEFNNKVRIAQRIIEQEEVFEHKDSNLYNVLDTAINYSPVPIRLGLLEATIPQEEMKKELLELAGLEINHKGQTVYEIDLTTHLYKSKFPRYLELRRFLIPASYNFYDLALVINYLNFFFNEYTVGFEVISNKSISNLNGNFPRDDRYVVSEYIRNPNFLKKGAFDQGESMKRVRLSQVLPENHYLFYIYKRMQETIQDVQLRAIVNNYTGEVPFLIEMTRRDSPLGLTISEELKHDPRMRQFTELSRKLWNQKMIRPRVLEIEGLKLNKKKP